MSENSKINYFPEPVDACPDVLDQASRTEQMERDNGVKAATLACAPQQHHRFDGIHCVEDDCGVVIPAERLAQGKVRCTSCQAELESANKQFRRG